MQSMFKNNILNKIQFLIFDLLQKIHSFRNGFFKFIATSFAGYRAIFSHYL